MTKPPVILVFGENDHDREVLVILVRALHPSAPRPEKRRKPLILIKDRNQAAAKKSAADTANQVRIERRIRKVPFVVAHQDCDAIEPAHIHHSTQIESILREHDVEAVAATPAWETESWLYLWPDAAPMVQRTWRRPNRDGSRVGLIPDAKEAFRRDVRPPGTRCRDYEESDAPRIVEAAVRAGLLRRPAAVSESYDRFVARLSDVAKAT